MQNLTGEWIRDKRYLFSSFVMMNFFQTGWLRKGIDPREFEPVFRLY